MLSHEWDSIAPPFGWRKKRGTNDLRLEYPGGSA